MFDPSEQISIRKQARLLEVSRSQLYYQQVIVDDSEVANLIRDIYLASDCRYGYRKITAALKIAGELVNKKRVLRLMQEMGIEGIYPRKGVKTTISNKKHNIYPYLLANIDITESNQVWATDITYIKLREGFMYFVAIMDLYSRYIISYDLFHSLDLSSCLFALRSALNQGQPKIFNSDQGCQFTSNEFVSELKAREIAISMDHKGRCFDNILVERLWRTLKQEVIYYYRPEDITTLEKCLQDFVPWYNNHRLHQSLGYNTPASFYYAG